MTILEGEDEVVLVGRSRTEEHPPLVWGDWPQ